MIPGFFEVYIMPGGAYVCAHCHKALRFIDRTAHHWDRPEAIGGETCPQKGMAFQLPVQTFAAVNKETSDNGV